MIRKYLWLLVPFGGAALTWATSGAVARAGLLLAVAGSIYGFCLDLLKSRYSFPR